MRGLHKNRLFSSESGAISIKRVAVIPLFLLMLTGGLMTSTPLSASAISQWDAINIPSTEGFVLSPGSEINKIAIGSDGLTFYTVDIANNKLYRSTNGGLTWEEIGHNLSSQGAGLPVWDIAVAPDDPSFVAVVTNNGFIPSQVWISTDAGTTWADTDTDLYEEWIGAIDISTDYGNKRDIVIGTREIDGEGYIQSISGDADWIVHDVSWTVHDFSRPVVALKFSPNYISDKAIAAVSADEHGTWVILGLRDVPTNPHNWSLFAPVEVKNPASPIGSSPKYDQIITADLELPSDFSGQTANLRRFYVSTDAPAITGVDTGIFRIDNTVVYTLMDTKGLPEKRISSIAYWGTHASGKLLAGEVKGDACTAEVPTWFNNSPSTNSSEWISALKPPTGAGGNGSCTAESKGWGNAQIVWSPLYGEQGVAYVGTSSANPTNGGTWTPPAGTWPYAWKHTVARDESAFGLTRNNGETWNQLSQIDTVISKLTDIAPAADCTTLYLASTNNGTSCQGFSSVWRSSGNPAIVSPPLPIEPVGSYWERILCQVTAPACTDPQSERAILRVPPDKADGQVVFWSAHGTRAVKWSPDFGDSWGTINPIHPVQDMAAESSTIAYLLSAAGLVQQLIYTGTAWSSPLLDVMANPAGGFTLNTLPGGYVLVGSSNGSVAYSKNNASTFSVLPENLPAGNVQVALDPDFPANKTIYAALSQGSLYRKILSPGFNEWTNLAPAPSDFFGIATARQGILYSTYYNGVSRTLDPRADLSNSAVEWDSITANLNAEAAFTLEPNSLKVCGDTIPTADITLLAIDTSSNKPLKYEDCVAKKGPALITADGQVIARDPATGQNVQFNLEWEQLCIADGYEIEISLAENFAMPVWAKDDCYPEEPTLPVVIVPAETLSSGLYYWRVRVRRMTNGEAIRSPWSETRVLTIGCIQDSDCDDGLDCTINTCPSGFCEQALTEATCLIDGVCWDEGESPADNVCYICSAAVDQHAWTLNNGAPCDDGNPDTIEDQCIDGVCTGTPIGQDSGGQVDSGDDHMGHPDEACRCGISRPNFSVFGWWLFIVLFWLYIGRKPFMKKG